MHVSVVRRIDCVDPYYDFHHGLSRAIRQDLRSDQVTDGTDKDLRRLFAEVDMEQRDEAFVQRVSAAIARQRRIRQMFRVSVSIALPVILPALVAGLVGTALIALTPLIMDGASYVALLSTLLVEPLAALLVSPIGWGVSLAVAVLALRRALAST